MQTVTMRRKASGIEQTGSIKCYTTQRRSSGATIRQCVNIPGMLVTSDVKVTFGLQSSILSVFQVSRLSQWNVLSVLFALQFQKTMGERELHQCKTTGWSLVRPSPVCLKVIFTRCFSTRIFYPKCNICIIWLFALKYMRDVAAQVFFFISKRQDLTWLLLKAIEQ